MCTDQNVLRLNSSGLKEVMPSGRTCPKGTSKQFLYKVMRCDPAHEMRLHKLNVAKIQNYQTFSNVKSKLGWIHNKVSPSPHHHRPQHLLQLHLHQGTQAPRPPPSITSTGLLLS